MKKPAPDAKAVRAAREAAALRANLIKRKEQARKREKAAKVDRCPGKVVE